MLTSIARTESRSSTLRHLVRQTTATTRTSPLVRTVYFLTAPLSILHCAIRYHIVKNRHRLTLYLLFTPENFHGANKQTEQQLPPGWYVHSSCSRMSARHQRLTTNRHRLCRGQVQGTYAPLPGVPPPSTGTYIRRDQRALPQIPQAATLSIRARGQHESRPGVRRSQRTRPQATGEVDREARGPQAQELDLRVVERCGLPQLPGPRCPLRQLLLLTSR